MTEENFWLMKSEPDAYSIDTLKNDGVTLWDGIRNYQARNFMRNLKIKKAVTHKKRGFYPSMLDRLSITNYPKFLPQ